jgi:hypothetical protein
VEKQERKAKEIAEKLNTQNQTNKATTE